jgi:hypothetical protein
MATYTINAKGSATMSLPSQIVSGDILIFNHANGASLNWTVPETGTYKIKAYGAKGGGSSGGAGGIIEGIISLNKGQILNLTSYAAGTGGGAGGIGGSPYLTANGGSNGGTGGGGTKIKLDGVLILAAGGGGGSGGAGGSSNGYSGGAGGAGSGAVISTGSITSAGNGASGSSIYANAGVGGSGGTSSSKFGKRGTGAVGYPPTGDGKAGDGTDGKDGSTIYDGSGGGGGGGGTYYIEARSRYGGGGGGGGGCGGRNFYDATLFSNVIEQGAANTGDGYIEITVINVIQNKYLFQDGTEIKKYKPKEVLNFNGSSSYVSVSNNPLIPENTPFTVEAKVFINSLDGSWRPVVDKYKANAYTTLGIWKSNDNCLSFTTGNGAWHDLKTSPIQAGKWYHVVAVWDGVNKYIYLDGVLVNQAQPAANQMPCSGAGNLTIGKRNTATPDGLWNGKINYLRIWNRALNASEIANNVSNNPIDRTGIVIEFLFYDFNDTQILDTSGNNLHGTMYEVTREKTGEGYWEAIGTAPATKSMFDQHGMTDLSIIDNNAIQQLTSDTPELLCWTDEEMSFTNVTPVMTSNTSPSPYVISASSVQGISYAYNAFNNDPATSWQTENYQLSGWLQIDFGSPKVITKYDVIANSNNDPEGKSPKDWTFEGSNDGISWAILDTQSNQTGWSGGQKREFPISNENSYRYYRINVSSNNGNIYNVNIGDIQLFESVSVSRQANLTAIPLPQLLLPVGDIEVGEIESVQINTKNLGTGSKSTTAIPKMTNNTTPSGIASASSQHDNRYAYNAFDGVLSGDYGGWLASTNTGWLAYEFPSPIIINQYSILVSQWFPAAPKNWTFEAWDEANSTWVVLDTRSNETSWTNIKRTYSFNNDKAYKKYRINITANNGDVRVFITEMEMFERNSSLGDIKILVSGDSGLTWQGKNGVVDISDLTQVKANGFTPDELNALTKQELASLFPNGKARFAFYLEQEKSTDIVQIDSLKINEKVYTMTPSIESLKVIYNLLETEKPKFYVSRDDGITWKEVQPDTLTSLEDLPEGNKLRVKAVLSNGQELHALSYSWI